MEQIMKLIIDLLMGMFDESLKHKPAPIKPLLLTLDDYFTSSGKYPDRALSSEIDDEVRKNAIDLLSKVNMLLDDLGVDKVLLSSGFRTSSANSSAGGAKRSGHMAGQSLDIQDDKEQSLAKLCAAHPALLRKYGLFLENPDFTKGKISNWLHLDTIKRSDRPSRQFNP
jgi:hypothetical protein